MSLKTGVSEGVSHSVSPEVSKIESVPRTSPECLGNLDDTLGALSGHFPEPGAGSQSVPKGFRETPWDTPSDTPVSGDTLRGTPPRNRARRSREIPVAGRRDRNNRANTGPHLRTRVLKTENFCKTSVLFVNCSRIDLLKRSSHLLSKVVLPKGLSYYNTWSHAGGFWEN